MIDNNELNRLLGLVAYQAHVHAVDGLEPFRDLLRTDSRPKALRFLTQRFPGLKGERRGGIAYVLAEHYRETEQLGKLEALFANDDPIVRESVLNALWEKPGTDTMGRAIVQLAITGSSDDDARVRAEASRVIQNQCAWRVDVAMAVVHVKRMLGDDNHEVRQSASYAIGNLAKRRYDVAACLPELGRNVVHERDFVRASAGWALWQMSRHKHDIASAVSALLSNLTFADAYARKNAIGALLHHAKKMPDNLKSVKRASKAATLDKRQTDIKRFLSELGQLR